MMPRPGTQALVGSRADKIHISALFASTLVRNNIFLLISETTNTILSGGGVSEIVVRDNDNLPGQRRVDLFERIFSEGGVVQNTCHFETTATDRRVTDWF